MPLLMAVASLISVRGRARRARWQPPRHLGLRPFNCDRRGYLEVRTKAAPLGGAANYEVSGPCIAYSDAKSPGSQLANNHSPAH